jgi:hypothetical protein
LTKARTAILLLVAALVWLIPQPVGATGTTYYVSSSAGSDTNAGTSESQPWKTLTKVNNTALQPGDVVKFKRGDSWTGRLLVTASGTSGSPIALGNYSTGSLPTVTGGASGTCIRLEGSYLSVDGLQANACGYAGFNIWGDYTRVERSAASSNAVGIKVSSGSDFGYYAYNTLADNNIMNVLTQGTNCGTPQAQNCGDDSGAFGFLVNGNDNEFVWNAVSGSNGFSYDYNRDGSAFEIYNGNRNNIHHNTSEDNNLFTELGVSTGTADGNVFSYNLVRADCGADCSEAGGVTLRGANSSYGPNTNTTIRYNTIWLDGPDTEGIVCHASCPTTTVVRGNILVADRNALWMDSSGWTEQYNVVNGPKNITLNSNSTTADAAFVSAPANLHLAGSSPAIDRAATSPYTYDLDNVAVPQNGNCAGGSYADSGTYEFDSPSC